MAIGALRILRGTAGEDRLDDIGKLDAGIERCRIQRIAVARVGRSMAQGCDDQRRQTKPSIHKIATIAFGPMMRDPSADVAAYFDGIESFPRHVFESGHSP
jgi:hypothetical protein